MKSGGLCQVISYNLVGRFKDFGFLLERDGKPFKHHKQMMGII